MSKSLPSALSALPFISSPTNPLIKRMRRLRDKRHRTAEKLFVAEGVRIACEAQAMGFLAQWLFVTEQGAERPAVAQLIEATQAGGGAVIRTTPNVLSKLSGKDNSQTVVGIYPQRDMHLTSLVGTSVDRAAATNAPLWIVAERLRDPGNLGTILRTGDAVGAGGLILLDDCTDPWSPEAVRASMGAIFTQQIAHAPSDVFLAWLGDGKQRKRRGQLVAAHGARASKVGRDYQIYDYRTVHYQKPSFLLVGNESQGLPESLLDAADIIVSIPMQGKADSLNVAIATAILAFHQVELGDGVGDVGAYSMP